MLAERKEKIKKIRDYRNRQDHSCEIGLYFGGLEADLLIMCLKWHGCNGRGFPESILSEGRKREMKGLQGCLASRQGLVIVFCQLI